MRDWTETASFKADFATSNETLATIVRNGNVHWVRKVYGKKNGAQLGGVSPDVIGPFLEKVCNNNGGKMYPIDVVLAAKPRSSPIHDLVFNPKCRRCAEDQARYVVRAITCKLYNASTGEFVTNVPNRLFMSSYYPNQVVDTDRPYRELCDVLSDPVETALQKYDWEKEAEESVARCNVFSTYADAFSKKKLPKAQVI